MAGGIKGPLLKSGRRSVLYQRRRPSRRTVCRAVDFVCRPLPLSALRPRPPPCRSNRLSL